jgi:hypothetical protein
MLSAEANFHVSGAMNRGTQQLHSVIEHVQESPKVNFWCGVMGNMIIGPSVFAKKTVTGSSYLDILQLYAFPQLEHLQPTRRSSTPLVARRAALQGRWIGRDDPKDWPPRSPDITPLDFFCRVM